MSVCAQCDTTLVDGAKFCNECGAAVAGAPQAPEQRKTVTALFCDLSGSTALGESVDPETLRTLLARYYDHMKSIVERHGGTVEKFIGDAVMAVFGVPTVHEDDALRACRAALEMRDAFPGLELNGRIGVNTGEVVTGVSGGSDRLATGDAINVAARLEQAAGVGQVLIGESTRRIVRLLVDTGERQQLTVKGKSETVSAYALLAVRGDSGSARRLDVSIVGRQREQRVLADAWDRAQSESACQLFTVLGEAGVGKSRLTLEFLSRVVRDATVLTGRSFSYGEGITYSPVLEMLTQTDVRPSDPRAAAALAALTRDSEASASSEEIAWGFRKLLEELAPVVVVFDDIHWSESTLLDLIDHIADWSRDAPILVLCLARPELLDHRPSWAGGKLNATTVLLEPLSAGETEELVRTLLGDTEVPAELRERILAAAQGNPLYVEEMLAMAADAEVDPDEISVPPTIQALLSARLDQLDRADRTVLERGSVEGQVFHLGGVAALAVDHKLDSELPRRAMSLVRKELVRPERPEFHGEDAFRFRHLLIRDAAYDGLPKATRGELHERFADWLEQRGDDLPELEEVAGYHLEQAYRYRIELGIDDERTRRIGERAAKHLRVAGDRAYFRQDAGAAVSYYRRLLALDQPDVINRRYECRLILALDEVGQLEQSVERILAFGRRAAALGDHRNELLADLFFKFMRTHVGECTFDDLDTSARRLIADAEPDQDDEALSYGWLGVSVANNGRCRWAAVGEAGEHASEHAIRCGDPLFANHVLINAVMAHVIGPTSVSDLRDWFAAQPDSFRQTLFVRAQMAEVDAMEGHVDRAREVVATARDELLGIGSRMGLAALGMVLMQCELMAGDPVIALEAARAVCAELRAMGELSHLSTIAGLGARACLRTGDEAEAMRFVEEAAETGSDDDVITQSLIGCARGVLASRAGDHEQAERLLTDACALLDETDMLNEQAEARVDLAEILAASGRQDEAVAALDDALARFTAKGNLARVGWAQLRRAQLQTA